MPIHRLVRGIVVVAAGYVVLWLAITVLSFVLVLGARSFYDDPRVDLVRGVENMRRVDAKVWAGGQPDDAGYRKLAELGIRTVVDLRTGADDDDREDDEHALRALGIEYRRLPIKDGHTPSARQVRAFHRIARSSDGMVFVHCGTGVGRTLALQSGYLALEGRNPRMRSLLPVGTVTIAQAWFMLDADAHDVHSVNPVVQRISELFDAPRRALSRLQARL